MLTRSYVTFALLLLLSSSSVHGDDKKYILMLAGNPSHGYGSHEHFAGLKVLEQAINEASDQVEVTTVKGWPADESLVKRADSIVIYCDGGGRHLAIPHLETLKNKLAEGCGLVCIHYAVEMVPGPPGDAWVEMLGGHFEIHWSVNPHWDADFKSMPDHPVTRGVKPFVTNDEWYFHMRFKDSDKVIPILAAVAPESTMRRKDGPHSGNPAVRKSVAAGEPQTLAWAYERSDGGRSFGFTGGHYHWNWGNKDQLRVMTNAIRWTAGDEITPEGSKLTNEIGMERLLENQDYDPPKNFNKEATQEKFKLQSSKHLPK
ncbi:MAG: ThuA domain-containing protein, partial [Planctomycetota bacterium]|nr:ThuA domain-containing protein [Planctomycetota bacterium]